uniref:Tumor necrosis factor receptor superfamily member 14-like n=1 Tax=Callorhinchus milii TaxID=7868 RepID=A0A4W3HL42_CALMI|eukprot:gi/632977599/ref/XP_007905437.1/ PREDICTED: tumor necrosis factor receptor superfamily member 14-like [Callorhinchus milii]
MLCIFIWFDHLQSVTCCDEGQYSIHGQCCQKCQAGSRVMEHCKEGSYSKCITCTQGEYISHPSGLEKCLKCDTCDSGMGLITAQECYNIQNSICHCKEGYFCVQREESGCKTCRKHSLCPVGERVKQKETIWEDAVCEKCPHGTYSDTVSTEQCKPWTKCEELNKLEVRPGNPSMDAECKEKMNIALIVLSIVIPVVIVVIGVGILWWKRRAVRKCTDGYWTHTDAAQTIKYCQPSDAHEPHMAASGTEAKDVDKIQLGNNQEEENVMLSISISNEHRDS